MNKYVEYMIEYIDEAIGKIKKGELVLKKDERDRGSVPIIWKGWSHSLKMEWKPCSFGIYDYRIIDDSNVYDAQQYLFECQDWGSNDVSGWIRGCLEKMKQDSLEMKELDFEQYRFARWNLHLGSRTLDVMRLSQDGRCMIVELLEVGQVLEISYHGQDKAKDAVLEYLSKRPNLYSELPFSIRDELVRRTEI